MGRPFLLDLCAALVMCTTARGAEPNQYLIISQPDLVKIVYLKITNLNWNAHSLRQQTQDLIADDPDLIQPWGLAVEPKTNVLFVADPKMKRIGRYQLVFSEGKVVVDGGMDVAAQDVTARWVAVDGVGNLFFTSGSENLVQMVAAQDILAKVPTRVQTLYDAKGGLDKISTPSGIAVDNFHMYFANGALGTEVGTLVKGRQNPPSTHKAASVMAMARNALQARGVCLSATDVFFTANSRFVYGMRQTGGKATTITDKLLAPRGCSWDGDGTVYVADRKGDAIYSFPGSMHTLTAQRIRKVTSVKGPFGLAMLSSAVRLRQAVLIHLALFFSATFASSC